MAYKLRTSYIPEIKALMFGRNTPGTVSVNLTNKCNLSCIYCEIGKSDFTSGNGQLNYEDMVWVIDEMSRLSMKRLAVNGGEPFLFHRLIDLVSLASRKKIECTLTSNGMSVHKLDERSLQSLKESKVRINISIDSFDNTINAITRGNKSALGNALASIKVLKEAGIPLKVLCVISKYNYTGLLEFVREAHRLGVPEVLFQPVIYVSNYPGIKNVKDKGTLNVDLDHAEILSDQINKIIEFERKHRIKTNVYRMKHWINPYLGQVQNGNGNFFFEPLLKRFYCREIDAIIEISFEGNIQACGLIASGISIRNRNDEGLLELWREAVESIKEKLSRKEYPPECNACCNHFSRNMIASILKYPLANRKMLFRMGKLWIDRGIHIGIKKLSLNQ